MSGQSVGTLMADTVRLDRSRSPNVSAREQTAPWMTAAAVMGADANGSLRGDEAARSHLGHIHQSLDQVYPPWTTGQLHCDEWVRNNVRDATCFAALASISVPSRLHIVRGAMNKVQLADPTCAIICPSTRPKASPASVCPPPRRAHLAASAAGQRL